LEQHRSFWEWTSVDATSFPEGDVPAELAYHDDCTLRQAASMIRRFHDVGAEFVSTLGDLPTDAETVCHNDLSPCNFVFRDGSPVAMIDFDAAAPGNRTHDLGYAAWLWLDLGDSEIAQSDQRTRLATFIEAYGMYEADVVISAVVRRQKMLCRRRASDRKDRDGELGRGMRQVDRALFRTLNDVQRLFGVSLSS
jgi:aminoglycoside phosphotransferase (APT) family kinase protein